MIRYLLDSSALWRLMREPPLRAAWAPQIGEGTIGSCHPQRAEFRRSARDLNEYERICGMYDGLYPDVPVPKSAWRWVESAQYRLLRAGVHKAASVVDLLVAATAAHHGITVLHDDRDFPAVAKVLTDVRERRIQDTPTTG
ncbi:MAG: PIN domain-containing protein [Micromonosporaceae bacterium]